MTIDPELAERMVRNPGSMFALGGNIGLTEVQRGFFNPGSGHFVVACEGRNYWSDDASGPWTPLVLTTMEA